VLSDFLEPDGAPADDSPPLGVDANAGVPALPSLASLRMAW